MKVWLRRILLGLAALIALVVVAFVVVVSIGIEVDLSPLKVPAQTVASTALGRDLTVEGSVVLIPTWSPTIEVQGLQIANPEGWEQPYFARMQRARVTVGVLPLLWRDAVVREISAEGVEVHFERRAVGEVNWLFGAPGIETPPEEDEEGEPFDLRTLFIDSASIDQIAFTDVVFDYRDAVGGIESDLELTSLEGRLGTHVPLELDLYGSLMTEDYQISVRGGPPVDLFRGEAEWPLELVVDIVDTHVSLKTVVEEQIALDQPADGPPARAAPSAPESAAAKQEPELADASGVPLVPTGRRFGKIMLSVSGEELESIERLLAVDLPPWGPHGLEATLEAYAGGRFAAEMEVRVGSSRLEGVGEARLGEPPRVDVKLRAPTLQLADFDTTGWSAFAGTEAAPAESAAPADPPEEESARPAALLDPATMRRIEGSVSVNVGQVLSGDDKLGRGRLAAKLEQGRLVLKPVEVEVPGGRAELTFAYHPTPKGINGVVGMKVERFDYGILARRADPSTNMGGLFALDVEIRSQAPGPGELMSHAAGHVDFAIFPRDFEAGIIDLWAVNVVTAVLPAVDEGKGSRLNCLVGLFDIQDGLMRQHTLVLDTSNMTVNGKADIDFRDQTLDVQLAPKAKKPQFFSVATPVQVRGDFDDFGLGVRFEDLLGTVISMATSVVHVPMRRIFRPPESGDELKTCMAAMDRGNGAPAVSAGRKQATEWLRPAPPSKRRAPRGTPAARIR